MRGLGIGSWVEGHTAAPEQQQAGRVLTRQQAQELVERIVRLSRADEIQVNVGGGYQANVRFADNRISTAGGVSSANVSIQSAFGKKHAVVQTNDFAAESLERAVRQSEALARIAPENPEYMGGLPPQQYLSVPSFFETTANLTPEQRAAAARAAIEPCIAAGDLKAAGFLITGVGAGAVGNNKGLFAYNSGTSANYTLTVRTTDGTGSGWAGTDHPDWTRVDYRDVSRRAIEKARASQNPQAVEPGRYTVILEAQAVGDLVQLLAFALDARSADEGRSAFSKQGGGTKVGEKIVDERVTLFSDPTDPQILGAPFDGQGLPTRRLVWIENGELKRLTHSRFWAQRKNEQPDAFTNALKLTGADTPQSVDDMIRSTPRGILVSRLWYLRQVDPRTVLYTGLTRDGTFLIENGRIAGSVKNMRFNESPLFILNNLEAIGAPMRLGGTEAGGAVVMPALKVRDFNFTSLSDAV